MKNIKLYIFSLILLLASFSAAYAYQPPCGTNGQIQYNNAGKCGGYSILPNSAIPAPGSGSNLGGIEGVTSGNANMWLTYIDESGLQHSSQPNFSNLATGTNTTAAMGVGTGASLFPTGNGTISANLIGGAPFVVQGLQACTTNATIAAANNALLQAALTAGGNVYIPVAASYCNSATLTIPNYTHFYAPPGTTIKNIAGVNNSVIQNANYTLNNGNVVGGANQYIIIENITFDGNGANQTVAFDPVDFDGVNYVWLVNVGATGGLRTGTFPTVSYDGEGIIFRDSQYFWVEHSLSYSNSYDGFKTRHSWDGHFLDDIAINNGRSGIQLAHTEPDTLALTYPSERIEVNNFTVISATGIPSASSPTVSGVYFHGANHSTVTNINAYGVQNCIGSDDGANYNVTIGVLCQQQNSATHGALEIEPSQSVSNTDVNNLIADVIVEPINGASNEIVATNTYTNGNKFSNIKFALGGASGTWTFTNAGTGNIYTDITGSNFSLSDTGTGTIFLSGYQGNGSKVQLSTGSTTTNDCVKFDANGNTIDAGAACGSGSGVTSVSSGTPNISVANGSTTPVISAISPLNAQGTTTPYAVATTDMGKTVTHNTSSGNIAVTLSAATTTGFTAGASFADFCLGTGTCAITPTTSTINGAASIILHNRGWAFPISDGTNYQALSFPGYGTITSGAPVAFTSDTSGALTAATYTNIVALFSGCSGTQYLGYDGNCHSASGSGTVTSVTYTGDGTVESSTPSSAVTTSGTLTATLANAGAGTVLGNATSSSAQPTYTATPQLGKSGTLGSITMGNATSGLLTLEPVTGALGTITASMPANTGTVAETNLAQTFSALQTYSATPAQYNSGGANEAAVYSNGNSGTSMALNCDNGNVQSVTITGAVTFTYTTPTHPCKFTLLVTEDGSGHIYAMPTATIWPGGVAPTYSTAANAKDAHTIIYDGTNYWGEGNTAFATSR